jgi:hypothetical protein
MCDVAIFYPKNRGCKKLQTGAKGCKKLQKVANVQKYIINVKNNLDRKT